MRKMFLSHIALLFFLSSFSQVPCNKDVGPVNAYYDAIALSRLDKGADSCTSMKALNILSYYTADKKSYLFQTSKLADLHKIAIGNIFKVDSVFAYFRKPGITPVKNETKQLGKLVAEYSTIEEDRAERADARTKLLSWDFQREAAEIFARRDTNRFPVKPALEDLYAGDTTFVNLLEKDTITLDTLPVVMQTLETVRLNVLKKYDDDIQKFSRSLTAKTTEITRYVTDNFSRLDSDLQHMISRSPANTRNNHAGPDLAVPNMYYSNSGAPDSFYNRNETFTLTNFKLPTQTEMIDALAIYLAKRFKQEVALTLIDQFRRLVKNDKLVTELFPETVKMFNTGKSYEMPSFGSAWNYAISKDFNNLLPNLATSSYVRSKIGDSLLVAHLRDVVSVCDLINKQYSYVDVVTKLYYQGTNSQFFGSGIAALQVINKELFDTASANRFWVTPERLYSMDEEQFEIFYSLIREKYRNRIGILEDADGDHSDIRNLLSSTLVLLNNFQASQRKALQVLPSQGTQLSNYWGFLTELFNVLNSRWKNPPAYITKYGNISSYSFELYTLLNQKNYAGAALKIMDLFPAISDKNYVDLTALAFVPDKLSMPADPRKKDAVNALVRNVDRLSGLLKEYLFLKEFGSEVEMLRDDYRQLLSDPRFLMFKSRSRNVNFSVSDLRRLVASDTTSLKYRIDSLTAAVKGNDVYREYIDKDVEKMVNILMTRSGDPAVQEYIDQTVSTHFDAYRKLTGFLSDLLLAGNSKNLSMVIEKYALPANSYKIKRSSRRSWDLNAYVGAYLGAEKLDGADNPVAGVYGFSAPIGLSYSWGRTMKDGESIASMVSGKRRYRPLRGNSVSLTLSLIDIGAVVSYRIRNTADGLPGEVRWSQVLSPGFHIRWGIKNTPLCFSTGVQNTPQLRTIESLNSKESFSALRTYMGLFF